MVSFHIKTVLQHYDMVELVFSGMVVNVKIKLMQKLVFDNFRYIVDDSFSN